MKKILSVILSVIMIFSSVSLMAFVSFAEDEIVKVTTIKLIDATMDFKSGDAPVFSAKSAEPEYYYVYLEEWIEVDGDKYITSADFFNRDPDKLITKFEEGKTYKYIIWVKPISKYDDNGNFIGYGSDLSSCRTLFINEEMYTLTDDMITDEGDAGIFLYPDFTITVTQENDIMLGDVNGDDKITIADAKWVLQSVANTRDLDEAQTAAADLNGDGKVTIADAKWILQVVAGTRVL